MQREFISKRANLLEASSTASIDAIVKDKIAKGEDVINFTVGEPYFPVPNEIKDAIKASLDENFTKYTTPGGIIPLKEAICVKLFNENNIRYNPENIIVTTGAKQALYNTFLATLDEGDEVIIRAPYWTSFPEMVKLAGGVPKIVAPRRISFIYARDIEDAITEKTKMLIINSPNNPSGHMYDKNYLEQIADIALKHNILVVSDEIYEKICYKFQPISIASLNEDIKNWTITINGFSKSYSMTGLRLGYAAANENIIKAMIKIQTQTTSAPTSIVQKSGIAALSMDQLFLEDRLMELMKNRDFVIETLKGCSGIPCVPPKGAFYAFPNVSKLYCPEVPDSVKFSELLLNKGVAVVPGKSFGDDRCVRISFAVPYDQLVEGMKRFRAAVEEM